MAKTIRYGGTNAVAGGAQALAALAQGTAAFQQQKIKNKQSQQVAMLNALPALVNYGALTDRPGKGTLPYMNGMYIDTNRLKERQDAITAKDKLAGDPSYDISKAIISAIAKEAAFNVTGRSIDPAKITQLYNILSTLGPGQDQPTPTPTPLPQNDSPQIPVPEPNGGANYGTDFFNKLD